MIKACQRCGQATSQLVTSLLTYEDDWRLHLCPACHRTWDWELWCWLNVSSNIPLDTETDFQCSQCDEFATDAFSVKHLGKPWYFKACDTHADQWISFIWLWLQISERAPRAFEPREKILPTKVAKPLVQSEWTLDRKVVASMPTLGVTWADVEVVLANPTSTLNENNGLVRYIHHTYTVTVKANSRQVVAIQKTLGEPETSEYARSFWFSPHARQRMKVRNVSEAHVHAVIDDGTKITLPGNNQVTDVISWQTDILKVVANPKTKEILTVFWREDSF